MGGAGTGRAGSSPSGGWQTNIWSAQYEKGDTVVVYRNGVEKEYTYHSKDPMFYGDNMHSVVDMTQKPRMLTHIHTANIVRYKKNK